MVALPLPTLISPPHSASGLTEEQRATLEALVRLWHDYAEEIAIETPVGQVARVVGQRRLAFQTLFDLVAQLPSQKKASLGPQEAKGVRLAEFNGMLDRVLESAQALSTPSRRALRGAIESFRAFLEWDAEDHLSLGEARETKLYLDIMDSLAEFEISVVVLNDALSGGIRSRPENLEALARRADRAMLSVEDVFLAADLEGETEEERSPGIPLEEVLRELGV